MIAVTPLASIAVGHRAHYVTAARSGHIAVLSKEGVGTLLAPDRSILTRFDLGCRLEAAAISPAGDLLAVVEDASIVLIQLPDFVEKLRLEGVFESCLFSLSGRWLWTALRDGSEGAAVEICDTKTGIVLSRAEVPDPFGEAGLMLFAQPSEDRVAMWLAAGQDGQVLIWCQYDGKRLVARTLPGLTETGPPGFDRAGERFLVACDFSVRLFKYPWGPELGRLKWPDDDVPPAEVVAFVDDDRAIAQSANGRLYLFDVPTMRIADEVVIVGHEARPMRDTWPNVPDAQRDELCSDLHTFYALPSGEFLSVHVASPTEDRRDHLLLIWKTG